MRRALGLLFALMVTCGCALCAAEAPPQPDTKEVKPRQVNCILISWDGLDRAVLKELLKEEKLPNLAALIKAGSLQDIDVKGHQTETRPSHAEMLTGLASEDSGVRSNSDDGSVPAGTSVFELIKKQAGGDKVATIMVTGKAYVGTLIDEKVREKAIDTCDIGSRAAARVGPLCLAALGKQRDKAFFAFFHFPDPDWAGHGSGRDSAEYRKAAAACDAWLGAITEQLKKDKIDTYTNIYVMADHGMDPGGHAHYNAPDSWLATNDKDVVRGGIIADVPATILVRFGVDVKLLKPALIGQSLTVKAVDRDEKATVKPPAALSPTR